jgi:hypothetical protein
MPKLEILENATQWIVPCNLNYPVPLNWLAWLGKKY